MTSVEVNPTVIQVAGSVPAPVTVDVNGAPVTVDLGNPAMSVSVAPQTVSVSVSQIGVPGPAGQQGLPGPPGGGTLIYGETPTGAKNGSNKVFTFAYSYAAGSTAVYRNGLRGFRGFDYNETGSNQITFSDAPLVDDNLIVDYTVGG